MSVRRNAWLSLTPEPERDLPAALAALRAAAGAEPSPEAINRERALAERLVVGGSRRRWGRWMLEARRLGERGAGGDPRLERAREVVLDVLDNHHALALGLPGRASREAEAERLRVAELRRATRSAAGGGLLP